MSGEPRGAGSPFEAVYAKILAGEAPMAVRSAAARGALPLPRTLLVHLYLRLREDPEDAIRSDAEASLRDLTTESIGEILADPGCPEAVLDHFASVAARNETLAESVAFHPNAGERALTALASEGNATVIELVLTNQQRLLTTPGLLDRLTMNPALRQDQRGRILDLLDRFVTAAPGRSSADAAEGGGDDGPSDAHEAARLLEVDVGELFAASEIVDGHEFEQSEDDAVRSAYKKILGLNTAQKAVLAMKGNREERVILVRDTNKVVALGVLKNPRLTELEVEAIARMRNVSDEVLRSVGISREWSKVYSIVSSLVRNPRTPPGVSTNFVTRLNTKDLKTLAGDKGVPEIIRRMAKKTFDLRTQKSTPAFRKK